MAKYPKCYAIYTFFTSPDSFRHTTLLNTEVLICYITLTFYWLQVATNYISTELALSKLKYGLHKRNILWQICLKIDRFGARNVPR